MQRERRRALKEYKISQGLMDVSLKAVGAIIASFFIGGFSFAWALSKDFAVVQDKMAVIEKSDLPNRMTRMEVGLENLNEVVKDMRKDTKETRKVVEAIYQRK